MIRHLNNFNELVLYAAISTGAAYFSRVNPVFYFPVLMLRIATLGYALYVIGSIQQNRPFALCLVSALILGWIGGYWDFLELQMTYNQAEFLAVASLILGGIIAALAVVLLRGKNG